MTRRKKILFIAIPLFFLMFGVIGYLFISSEYFLDNYIKDRLRQALQGQINGNYEVDIDKLRGNVLTGVEIENLSINEKNSGLPPILSTEKVVLKYHIFPLLRGKILSKSLLPVDDVRSVHVVPSLLVYMPPPTFTAANLPPPYAIPVKSHVVPDVWAIHAPSLSLQVMSLSSNRYPLSQEEHFSVFSASALSATGVPFVQIWSNFVWSPPPRRPHWKANRTSEKRTPLINLFLYIIINSSKIVFVAFPGEGYL